MANSIFASPFFILPIPSPLGLPRLCLTRYRLPRQETETPFVALVRGPAGALEGRWEYIYIHTYIAFYPLFISLTPGFLVIFSAILPSLLHLFPEAPGRPLACHCARSIPYSNLLKSLRLWINVAISLGEASGKVAPSCVHVHGSSHRITFCWNVNVQKKVRNKERQWKKGGRKGKKAKKRKEKEKKGKKGKNRKRKERKGKNSKIEERREKKRKKGKGKKVREGWSKRAHWTSFVPP